LRSLKPFRTYKRIDEIAEEERCNSTGQNVIKQHGSSSQSVAGDNIGDREQEKAQAATQHDGVDHF
jgi:hypothetical protein